MTLSLHDFIQLLFATLVNEEKNGRVFLASSSKKAKKAHSKESHNVAWLPFNYRERIQNILCAENGWKEMFSILIDVDDYFKDHFWWEERLADEISNFTQDRKISIDWCRERFVFYFTQQEIDAILSSFDDENLRKVMCKFASLLVDRLYSREHMEEFADYTSRSRKMMHDLLQAEYKRGIES